MRNSSPLSVLLATALVSCALAASPGVYGHDEYLSCPGDCNFHGYCHSGQCVCYPGWIGDDCMIKTTCPNHCNYQGYCKNGTCACYPGFSGGDCSSRFCPNDCWNRGKCIEGKCACFANYTGNDCGILKCKNDCTSPENGVCINGVCKCLGTFAGEDCSQLKCAFDCGPQGECIAGECSCLPGFGGKACEIALSAGCLLKCSGHGTCLNGTCFCRDDFIGPDCAEKYCSLNCKHGERFSDGGEECYCRCYPGWKGDLCESRGCPNDCSGHGECFDTTCDCDKGWFGDECNLLMCPGQCSGKGTCVNGTCLCAKGYWGEDCSGLPCPVDNFGVACSGRGECQRNGICKCEHWWEGTACENKKCISGCSGHGKCFNGTCLCHAGFGGDECGVQLCPRDCAGHGTCTDGQCVCEHGFTGPDCGEASCPEICEVHGKCKDGVCFCAPGWWGPLCEHNMCPHECRGQGRCVDGVCLCNVGWGGLDCSEKECPNKCSGKGICDDKTWSCKCDAGWTGDDCSYQACASDCSGVGRCYKGQCFCPEGTFGDECQGSTCHHQCNGNGICRGSTCYCFPGFTGAECTTKTCPKCVHGTCDQSNLTAANNAFDCEHRDCKAFTCKCNEGWNGPLCDWKNCPAGMFNRECSGHGHCNNGTCFCDNGWTGPLCDQKLCYNNCYQNGICNNGTCECFKGFQGEDCSQTNYNRNCKCAIRCADICLANCRGAFESKGHDAGRECYLDCSRSCFVNCIKGHYEESEPVTYCTSSQCKEAKSNSATMRAKKILPKFTQFPNAKFTGLGNYVQGQETKKKDAAVSVLESEAIKEIKELQSTSNAPLAGSSQLLIQQGESATDVQMPAINAKFDAQMRSESLVENQPAFPKGMGLDDMLRQTATQQQEGSMRAPEPLTAAGGLEKMLLEAASQAAPGAPGGLEKMLQQEAQQEAAGQQPGAADLDLTKVDGKGLDEMLRETANAELKRQAEKKASLPNLDNIISSVAQSVTQQVQDVRMQEKAEASSEKPIPATHVENIPLATLQPPQMVAPRAELMASQPSTVDLPPPTLNWANSIEAAAVVTKPLEIITTTTTTTAPVTIAPSVQPQTTESPITKKPKRTIHDGPAMPTPPDAIPDSDTVPTSKISSSMDEKRASGGIMPENTVLDAKPSNSKAKTSMPEVAPASGWMNSLGERATDE